MQYFARDILQSISFLWWVWC